MFNVPRVMVLVLVLTSVTVQSNLEAAIFVDQSNFLTATTGEVVIDFQDFPVNGSGYGAFGNGFSIGNATFTSLTLLADANLRDVGGVDTGLDGTFLVDQGGEGASPDNIYVRPGGQGPFGLAVPESNDDFRIDFALPVSAAGLLILDSVSAPGESIQFLNDTGAVIATVGLPDEDGFIGFIVDPGGDLIHSIVVLEGSGSEDIAFDDVVYVAVPEVPTIFTAGISVLPFFFLWRRTHNQRKPFIL